MSLRRSVTDRTVSDDDDDVEDVEEDDNGMVRAVVRCCRSDSSR